MKEMKRVFTGLFLLCSLLLTSCSLVVTEDDIGMAKTQVNCRYTICGDGTTFTWNYPSALAGNIKRFFISENSDSKLSSSFTCWIVPTQYRHDSYSDQVSIKETVSEVKVTWKGYTTEDYYLWAEVTDGYYYNLGKFRTTISDIDKVKETIKFNKTYNSTYNETTFEWAVRTAIPLNPIRFLINTDETSEYDSKHVFDKNLIIGDSYHDDSYSDSVSITPGICNTQADGMDTYKVVYEGSVSKTYYLWVQIEDGRWYNLGCFPFESVQRSL